MSIMYLLVPLALLLAGLAVAAFVWSARQGQMDDLVTPALRMLHDDDETTPPRDGVGHTDHSGKGRTPSDPVSSDTAVR